MTQAKARPRTYNQVLVPRRYTPGKRRFSIYWTWSYPWEANRDVTEMDNRFSTMTEVRRVLWPDYETLEYSEKMFLQGIAGTLELFHLGLRAISGRRRRSRRDILSPCISGSIRPDRNSRSIMACSTTPTP